MFVPGYRPEYIFSCTAQAQLPPDVIGPTPDDQFLRHRRRSGGAETQEQPR
jgi:hypothetical protein